MVGVAVVSGVVVGYFIAYGSSSDRQYPSIVEESDPFHEMNTGWGGGWMDWLNHSILPTVSSTLQGGAVAIWEVFCDKCMRSLTLAEKVVKFASIAFREGSELIVTNAPDIANAVDHATSTATSIGSVKLHR